MKNQSRIVIENISPEINNGDFNIKRVVNEIVNVSADVMADGHDIIATSVLFKYENSKKWEEVRMSPHFDNKWSASFTVEKQGFYSYKVIGWVDYALNWQHGISRKIVLDFKKISVHQADLIDLWLYRTEMMIKYTMSYGDIDEAFYNSLATGFEAACKLIQQEQLEEHYLIYCKELITPLADIGWGVYDDCYTDYNSYFGLD